MKFSYNCKQNLEVFSNDHFKYVGMLMKIYGVSCILYVSADWCSWISTDYDRCLQRLSPVPGGEARPVMMAACMPGLIHVVCV